MDLYCIEKVEYGDFRKDQCIAIWSVIQDEEEEKYKERIWVNKVVVCEMCACTFVGLATCKNKWTVNDY